MPHEGFLPVANNKVNVVYICEIRKTLYLLQIKAPGIMVIKLLDIGGESLYGAIHFIYFIIVNYSALRRLQLTT